MTTPCFVYDLDLLKSTLLDIIHEINHPNVFFNYDVAANHKKEVLDTISTYEFGASCKSVQDVENAIEGGFSPDKITFTSKRKIKEEFLSAIAFGVGTIQCDDIHDLAIVDRQANKLGKTVSIALKIDLNSMAGLSILLESTRDFKHIKIDGLSVNCTAELKDSLDSIISVFTRHSGQLSFINISADFELNRDGGITDANFKKSVEILSVFLAKKEIQLNLELGNSIVGPCGKLVTKVISVEDVEAKPRAFIDAEVTKLSQSVPAGDQREIEYLGIAFKRAYKTYSIVDPISKTNRSSIANVQLPNLRQGDLLAIKGCGAYHEFNQ